MAQTRYFEKDSAGVVRFWQIRHVGIRCHMAWGRVGGVSKGLTMTLDDEAHAARHFAKKVSEKLRQGYVEVTPVAEPAKVAADLPLLDVMRAQEEKRYAGAWDFHWSGYEPVPGYAGTYAKFHDFTGGPGPFYDYLVLSEDERRGLEFVVKRPGHDPAVIAAFLDFVRPRLGLVFDGRSHHKVRLPSPIGQFDHVLFCAPSLNHDRYGGRLGKALPVLDCEIADEDTEVLVAARLQGRDAMPSTTWDRKPCPVIDLTFDLRSLGGFAELGGTLSVREKKFKVYPRTTVERVLRLLAEAQPDSWLRIRNYRRDVLTLTPPDLTPETAARVDGFLRGDSAAL
ncbi:WGR domain-containing protein [Streptomyces sp. NPDC051940]|uniref:WGR domain-containing protein n=1 Tax=Streptomyces sp. NPDC051940 TaxID=3155675 RepID=UPI003419F8BF